MFFFRAFKSKALQDHISVLSTDSQASLVDENEIAKHLLNFFGSIISALESLAPDYLLQQLFLAFVSPILDMHQASWLERPIPLEECLAALNCMGKDKYPSWDGITVPFLLHFWTILAASVSILVNSLFFGSVVDPGLTRGLIKLIPKQLACSLPKHLRPISMMPVVYKIAAKTLASRLMPILHPGITPHQHGFIKGRPIFDNILSALVGIDYAQASTLCCSLIWIKHMRGSTGLLLLLLSRSWALGLRLPILFLTFP